MINNRNRIQRPKKKFTIIDITVILIILMLDIVLIFNYANVVVENNNLSTYDAIVKTMDRVESSPFKVDYKNNNIQKVFIDTHKDLYLFYLILFMLYVMAKLNVKSDFKGIEHGSAHWASKRDRSRFKLRNGIILSDELQLSLKDEENINLNVMNIGGSGSRKTFSLIKPTIMNMIGSYVVTDPKGELYRDSAYFLKKNGYVIKVLNVVKPKYSDGYNPFRYLNLYNEDTLEVDILKLVNTFMANTSDPGSKGDKFWDDAVKALLSAICFYLVLERPINDRNFEAAFELVRMANPKDEEETGSIDEDNPLELIFTDLADKNAYHPGVKCYEEFKLAAGKTAKSILVSLAVRLNLWIARDICTLTSVDELELEKLGTRKTALFLITPDDDDTFKAITSMFFSQLMNILYGEADYRHNGLLPVFVDCLLDEFANIGEIPNMDKYITTCRSRNIGISPVIQSISQLKKTYKDHWETIIGGCYALNYLGTQDMETLEYISKKLGKTTVRLDTSGTSKGKHGSRSANTNYVQRDLMSPTEIFEIKAKYSIVFIKEFSPFFTRKFNTQKHPLYKTTGSGKYNPAFCTDVSKEYAEIADKKAKEYFIAVENRKNIIEAILLEKAKEKKKKIEAKVLKKQLKIEAEMDEESSNCL